MRHSLCFLAAFALGLAVLRGDDLVRVGAGSYTTRAPEGAKLPPATIFRTAPATGPIPTNRWWSSLAWTPLSDAMYPHPLALRAVERGLRVAYPGAHITANKAAIMGAMPSGGDDFIIGHAAQEKFPEARVDAFSDWFVSALFATDGNTLRASFGHGSPFVFVTLNGDPTLSFKSPPLVWSGSAKDAVLGISVGDRHYGIFAPEGSVWSNLGAQKWKADTHGRGYFSIAILPDDKADTLALFRRHAFSHVTDTKISWSYDERRAVVRTTFAFTTKNYEGAAAGTLFALYPHQWTCAARDTKMLNLTYNSVRGPMKLAEGASFVMEMTYPGVLPSLPLADGVDRAKLAGLIQTVVNEPAMRVGDTYGLGKQLGKWATRVNPSKMAYPLRGSLMEAISEPKLSPETASTNGVTPRNRIELSTGIGMKARR